MATPQGGVWGIDLGQGALKAIRLQVVGGEVRATAFDYIEHPKILSQPDADPDQLTREALEQFLSRNQLKGDAVVIGVPGQTGLARFIKLPPVEERKVAEIVRFEAKQQIPFPLEEVVWDFQKIGAGNVTGGFAMEAEIGLFAMKRDLINRTIDQFREVGVEVHIVQMAPLALTNFIAYEMLGKGKGGEKEEGIEEEEGVNCVVALEIGTDNSNLIITDANKIIWQRPIPMGGNHFTRALTKDLKLTFAKAEHLKRNATKSPDLKKILASLKTVLNDFVSEVQRSLGYFTNTHRDATIKFMVGVGNGFRLPGLQKYLQDKLQLEVKKLTKLRRISGDEVVSAPQFTENILAFAVALGLALQGLNKALIVTNLLPGEIRTERMVRAKKPWAAAAVAFLLLALAGITFASSVEMKSVKNAELTGKKDLAKAAVDEAASLNSEYKVEEDKLLASEESIRRIQGGLEERFNWQDLYQYVNMALPRADGDKLGIKSRKQRLIKEAYKNAESDEALAKLEARRFTTDVAKIPIQQIKEDDKFIKQHLIQVNVEGVTPMYVEDIPAFFKSFPKEHILRAMDYDEAQIVQTIRDGGTPEDATKMPPTKGWVIEVRGYTYHKDAEIFVEDTIVENLARPKNVNPTMPEELKKVAEDKIKFIMLYRIAKVVSPRRGDFQLIATSTVSGLVNNPVVAVGVGAEAVSTPDPVAGAEDPATLRKTWMPRGEVASKIFVSTAGGAAGGDTGFRTPVDRGPDGLAKGEDAEFLVPRTEFVIFFVWDEPLPENAKAAEEAAAAAATTTTP